MIRQLDHNTIPTELGEAQVLFVLLFAIVSTVLVTQLSHTVIETTPEIDRYLQSLTYLQQLIHDIYVKTPAHPAFNLDNLENYRALTTMLVQASVNLAAIQVNLQDPASTVLPNYFTSFIETRVAFEFLSDHLI